MELKTLPLSQSREKVKRSIIEPLNKTFRWRWISILLLGALSNTLVNIIFDLKYHRSLVSFSVEEYYNALIVSLILLEGTRSISSALDKKLPWETNKVRRILVQSGWNLIFGVFALNTLIIGITYIFYGSFYAFEDLLLINLAVLPLTLIFSLIGKERSIKATSLSLKIFKWNWISIILLGISCNTLINIIFDYKYQRSLVSFSIEEYFNAIFAASILLGGTRWVTKKLESKIPWDTGVTKRLTLQLSIHLIFIVIALNVLLITVTYALYGGFYKMDELMVINISVISLTFFFSIIDTSIYFFKRSRGISVASKTSAEAKSKPIQVSLGKVHHLIRQETILCAISQSRLVFVVTEDNRRLPYSESLDKLEKTLDPLHFFRANRQTVLTRAVVQSIRPLEHGKIKVALVPINGQPDSIVVSRTRASQFRKWLKSQAA